MLPYPAHPSGGSTKRLAFTFTAQDVALLRLLRDRMTALMGQRPAT